MGDRITVEGFVEKLFVKEGTSARGKWVAYSIKLQRASGEVDPRFYQFGFTKPGFGEGDFIRFEAEIKDDKAAKFIEGSGSKPKNPPAKPAAPQQPSAGGRPGGGGGFKQRPPVESKLFGRIGQNSTEDDIRRICYSNARSAALEAVAVLLANDGLVTSTAKTKGGEAKRYDEIVAAIDKLTVKYFFDAAGGRLLTSVADEGSKETRTAALPDAQPGKPEASTVVTIDPPEDPDEALDDPSLREDPEEDEKF